MTNLTSECCGAPIDKIYMDAQATCLCGIKIGTCSKCGKPACIGSHQPQEQSEESWVGRIRNELGCKRDVKCARCSTLVEIVSQQIEQAKKEERDTWLHQKANDHDNRIRQSEKQKIIQRLEKQKIKGEGTLAEFTNDTINLFIAIIKEV